jgi:hypothetical protein
VECQVAASNGGPLSSSAPRIGFFRSFTGRLCILLFLIVIPALLLTLYGNLQQRHSETSRLREGALAISGLAAADQENFIRNTRQLLGTLTQFPTLLLSSNRAFSDGNLSNLRKLMPDYANFGLIETNGILFCSAEPITNSVYLGDRTYFTRAMQTKTFAAGDFQISRVTGDATLGFGYPVVDQQGNVARVLYGTLKLSKLSEVINQIQVPQAGAIEILDSTGTVLARNPRPEKRGRPTPPGSRSPRKSPGGTRNHLRKRGAGQTGPSFTLSHLSLSANSRVSSSVL